jgi:hypothetical protein
MSCDDPKRLLTKATLHAILDELLLAYEARMNDAAGNSTVQHLWKDPETLPPVKGGYENDKFPKKKIHSRTNPLTLTAKVNLPRN